MVYLSGSLNGGTTDNFSFLPSAARPNRWLYITVYTFGGSRGTLQIRPDGSMYAYSTPTSDATGYTSLATVSYPITGAGRHKLALRNGWLSSQGTYDTGDPAYTVSGVVYLSGSLHGGASASFFATLPAAARPVRIIVRQVYTFGGTSGDIVILPNGSMALIGTSVAEYTSLAAISFPTAKVVKHKLTLRNGWKSGERKFHAGDPAYAVIGHVVYLYGSLHQSSGTNEFAVLPRAARPAHNLYITIFVYRGVPGTLLIEPSGRAFLYSSPTSASQIVTLLAAISYPRSS